MARLNILYICTSYILWLLLDVMNPSNYQLTFASLASHSRSEVRFYILTEVPYHSSTIVLLSILLLMKEYLLYYEIIVSIWMLCYVNSNKLARWL